MDFEVVVKAHRAEVFMGYKKKKVRRKRKEKKK